MRVIIIPSWYSSPLNPMHGSFFRDQAIGLKRAGIDSGIIAPVQRRLGTLSRGKIYAYNFKLSKVHYDSRVPIIYSYGWGTRYLKSWNINLWIFQARRILHRYIRDVGRPDIIHAHSVMWAGIAARTLAKEEGIRYIITEHSTNFLRSRVPKWAVSDIFKAFQNAAQIIAVSRVLSVYLKQYVGQKPIEVIPNTVDTKFFTLPTSERKPIPFRFLCIAFHDPRKGVDVLLKAFAKSFKGRKEIILEIGGDGDQRKYLEKLAIELGIYEQVRFLGMLQRTQVKEAMWRANIFVLPSYAETFGVVLIEAMATGLNVVSTRCGGPEEIVTEELGSLVEPGNVDELAQALIHARNNYKPSRPMEMKFRNHAEEYFGEKAITAKLIDLYNSISNSNYGSSGGKVD